MSGQTLSYFGEVATFGSLVVTFSFYSAALCSSTTFRLLSRRFRPLFGNFCVDFCFSEIPTFPGLFQQLSIVVAYFLSVFSRHPNDPVRHLPLSFPYFFPSTGRQYRLLLVTSLRSTHNRYRKMSILFGATTPRHHTTIRPNKHTKSPSQFRLCQASDTTIHGEFLDCSSHSHHLACDLMQAFFASTFFERAVAPQLVRCRSKPFGSLRARRTTLAAVRFTCTRCSASVQPMGRSIFFNKPPQQTV